MCTPYYNCVNYQPLLLLPLIFVSRWQWIALARRGAKLPFVNAVLRLGYSCFDGNCLPANQRELVPLFQQVRATDMEEAKRLVDDLLPVGRSGTVPNIGFAVRFNLTADEVHLLRVARHGGHEAATKETTWATYCRQVLQPLRFYTFDAIRPRT